MTDQTQKITIGVIGTALGVVALILSTGGWINGVNTAINKIPKIEQEIKEAQRDKDLKDAKFIETMSEIKTAVKVLEVKIDDVKANGKGQYNEVTTDSIQVIKRYRK